MVEGRFCRSANLRSYVHDILRAAFLISKGRDDMGDMFGRGWQKSRVPESGASWRVAIKMCGVSRCEIDACMRREIPADE